MTEPIWLELELLLAIHEEQLAEHGGAAGIRDGGMLESAIHRPINKFHYGETSVHVLAAAYAYGIAMNHPFVDGNKRTAWIACRLFLNLNGERMNAPKEDRYNAMISLAEGSITEDQFAEWVRLVCVSAS